MTTQLLMSNCSTLSQATSQSTAVQSEPAVEVSSSVAGIATSTSQSPKLPYQTNHQAEWLHLQAEAEALLQQLIELKQQRHESSEADRFDESPVLVGR
jgi:hypothetical protein